LLNGSVARTVCPARNRTDPVAVGPDADVTVALRVAVCPTATLVGALMVDSVPMYPTVKAADAEVEAASVESPA
jgi:hypothetical protein